MTSEWKTYTVQELIDAGMLEEPLDGNHGGIHPKASDYVSSGVPFIMANNLVNGKVDYNNCVFITEKQASTLRKGFAKPGDVLLTHKATIGRTAIVGNEYETIILTPQVTYYRVKHGISNRYLKYYFDSSEFQQLFSNWAGSGSTRAYLGITAQHKLPIVLPPYEIQLKIAHCCGALDDKIFNNQTVNDNLQQQAQVLYKHYFPYSVGDELPDGWRIGSVGEIIEIHDSKRIPLSGAERAKMEKKTYPYYGAAALMDYVDDYIFDGKYLLLGEDGTVVDKAGYPILQYVWGQFWVNNHAHILTGKLGFNVESLYMLFKQTPVKAIVTGAVQPKISQTNLRSIQAVIPPQKLLTDYNSQIAPLFALLRTNEETNKSLTALRDTLLPKLMSGELDVSNIQL